jgi:putative transposase
MIEFKGSHFEREVILWGVRWYVAYPISYRQLEELMDERGVEVDHSTLNRWVVKYVPLLEKQFRARKRLVGSSWRLDETYVKVKGVWKYLYRAVDKAGATVDFLMTAKRDCKAALRFLRKAIGSSGTPEKITIDKSGANTAAIESHNAETQAGIEMRQIKYLNNMVEQDHRGHQATNATDAWVQILLVSRRDARRDRDHAYDPEGPVGADRRIVSSATVLFTGGVDASGFTGCAWPRWKFATEPKSAAHSAHLPTSRP